MRENRTSKNRFQRHRMSLNDKDKQNKLITFLYAIFYELYINV